MYLWKQILPFICGALPYFLSLFLSGYIVLVHCFGNIVMVHCYGNIVMVHCYGSLLQLFSPIPYLAISCPLVHTFKQQVQYDIWMISIVTLSIICQFVKFLTISEPSTYASCNLFILFCSIRCFIANVCFHLHFIHSIIDTLSPHYSSIIQFILVFFCNIPLLFSIHCFFIALFISLFCFISLFRNLYYSEVFSAPFTLTFICA